MQARLAADPDAQVAQLVEHVTENHGVGGSIPPLGTNYHRHIKCLTSIGFDGRGYPRRGDARGTQIQNVPCKGISRDFAHGENM